MARKLKIPSIKKDNNYGANLMLVIICVLVVCLVFNVVYLGLTGKHLISGNDISAYATQRGGSQKVQTLTAKRGTIYSSNDEVLVTDVTKYKVYAILSTTRTNADGSAAYVEDKEYTAEMLAEILGGDYDDILEKLNKDSYQVEFGSIGNNISSLVKEEIEALDLPGIEFEETTTRSYRYGDFASYEIGYAQIVTDEINGQTTSALIGQMGIEKVYDEELSGTDGQRIYLADNNDNVLPNGIVSETSPVAGNDIYLTLDTDIQTELTSQLSKLCEAEEADQATCAIMNAKTGAILAVTNYPSFDPNERDTENYVDLFLNEAVEPGSVFKSFVYANAINDSSTSGFSVDNTYTSGTYYYSSSSSPIKDHNSGQGWGVISYKQGFYYSSNTAICNILSTYTDKDSLIADYEALGLFQSDEMDGLSTASGVAGYVNNDGRIVEWLTTGFGQGSTVTAYQLLKGYSAFANDGKTVKPYIVDKIVDSETDEVLYQASTQYSQQIYSSETVEEMRDLLSGVINISGSTGYKYHMDDIHLIGKTGTGQIAQDGAYVSGYYTHSFCGLAPYDDPEIVIVLWYQSGTTDNTNAATLVQAVVRSALNKLNEQEIKVVASSSYTLDSYTNQSTSYVSSLLSTNQLTPVVIGDGDIVLSQYPYANTEVASESRVFLKTNGTTITMPSMEGWSRKEAEAFATMADVTIEVEGTGTIYDQSVSKGTTLEAGQTITVYAD